MALPNAIAALAAVVVAVDAAPNPVLGKRYWATNDYGTLTPSPTGTPAPVGTDTPVTPTPVPGPGNTTPTGNVPSGGVPTGGVPSGGSPSGGSPSGTAASGGVVPTGGAVPSGGFTSVVSGSVVTLVPVTGIPTVISGTPTTLLPSGAFTTVISGSVVTVAPTGSPSPISGASISGASVSGSSASGTATPIIIAPDIIGSNNAASTWGAAGGTILFLALVALIALAVRRYNSRPKPNEAIAENRNVGLSPDTVVPAPVHVPISSIEEELPAVPTNSHRLSIPFAPTTGVIPADSTYPGPHSGYQYSSNETPAYGGPTSYSSVPPAAPVGYGAGAPSGVSTTEAALAAAAGAGVASAVINRRRSSKSIRAPQQLDVPDESYPLAPQNNEQPFLPTTGIIGGEEAPVAPTTSHSHVAEVLVGGAVAAAAIGTAIAVHKEKEQQEQENVGHSTTITKVTRKTTTGTDETVVPGGPSAPEGVIPVVIAEEGEEDEDEITEQETTTTTTTKTEVRRVLVKTDAAGNQVVVGPEHAQVVESTPGSTSTSTVITRRKRVLADGTIEEYDAPAGPETEQIAEEVALGVVGGESTSTSTVITRRKRVLADGTIEESEDIGGPQSELPVDSTTLNVVGGESTSTSTVITRRKRVLADGTIEEYDAPDGPETEQITEEVALGVVGGESTSTSTVITRRKRVLADGTIEEYDAPADSTTEQETTTTTTTTTTAGKGRRIVRQADGTVIEEADISEADVSVVNQDQQTSSSFVSGVQSTLASLASSAIAVAGYSTDKSKRPSFEGRVSEERHRRMRDTSFEFHPVEDQAPDLTEFVPPAPTSHVASVTFRRRQSDELNIDIGDLVGIEREYSDGWARAQNITQGRKRGLVPIKFLTPIKSGPSQKVAKVGGGTWIAKGAQETSQSSIQVLSATGVPDRDRSLPGRTSSVGSLKSLKEREEERKKQQQAVSENIEGAVEELAEQVEVRDITEVEYEAAPSGSIVVTESVQAVPAAAAAEASTTTSTSTTRTRRVVKTSSDEGQGSSTTTTTTSAAPVSAAAAAEASTTSSTSTTRTRRVVKANSNEDQGASVAITTTSSSVPAAAEGSSTTSTSTTRTRRTVVPSALGEGSASTSTTVVKQTGEGEVVTTLVSGDVAQAAGDASGQASETVVRTTRKVVRNADGTEVVSQPAETVTTTTTTTSTSVAGGEGSEGLLSAAYRIVKTSVVDPATGAVKVVSETVVDGAETVTEKLQSTFSKEQ
ncbi:uncharacterized protein BJ171DRAFT_292577 [Polychytrium aggregatum]|uniref:uncharacterized protein n=1 Tax=Polychytrium aggregatum TaxID=110093 RepID=UPI0022FDD3AF|nr:uncharacterized protein BJ171DRAFT_292577 [Polychytrium aggregatum]KAI9207168.1 hypothetical protein BJ171DRAFT_292577 [Polychytrium aggregatum]